MAGEPAIFKPEDVWAAAEHAALEAKARHILAALVDKAGLFDSVTTGERELAELTGFSRWVVWRRLHELEEAGWLTAERHPHGFASPTVYHLRIPAAAR